MARKPTNFARFYALLSRMPGDQAQVKETLVERFSQGRTTSLRQLTAQEYERMCEAMEAEAEHPGMSVEEFERERKRLRSAVLTRIQRLGVDTTDWKAVDDFCLDPRIAAKAFAKIPIPELKALIPRLEAILRKPAPRKRKKTVYIPLIIRANQLPS